MDDPIFFDGRRNFMVSIKMCDNDIKICLLSCKFIDNRRSIVVKFPVSNRDVTITKRAAPM